MALQRVFRNGCNGSLLCLAVVMTLVGCRPPDRPADLPKLYPCSVTVTQEKKPVADAEIELFSLTPGFKWTVYGRTDSQGTAKLTTYGRFSGAPEGVYKIVVSKRVTVQERAPKVHPNDPSIVTGGGPTIVFSLIEKQYLDRSTTPLEWTVPRGGAQTSFEIGREVRERIAVIMPP